MAHTNPHDTPPENRYFYPVCVEKCGWEIDEMCDSEDECLNECPECGGPCEIRTEWA